MPPRAAIIIEHLSCGILLPSEVKPYHARREVRYMMRESASAIVIGGQHAPVLFLDEPSFKAVEKSMKNIDYLISVLVKY